MSSIILVNDELVKLIKKAKLKTIEEVNENFVIENFVVNFVFPENAAPI